MQSVCTEVLFVLDSKNTHAKKVFPIQISVFLQQQLSHTGRSMRQIVGYAGMGYVMHYLTPTSAYGLAYLFRIFNYDPV